jgi:metal-dependent amidase/aminoacylase/carboxypeptidase family protein
MEITGGDRPYAHVVHDLAMAALYRQNAEALGRPLVESPLAASTDMGNVSLAMPTIHPMIGINSLPAVNHQPEFTAHCNTPDADQAVMDGAVAMAWTAIDMGSDDTMRARLTEHAYHHQAT